MLVPLFNNLQTKNHKSQVGVRGVCVLSTKPFWYIFKYLHSRLMREERVRILLQPLNERKIKSNNNNVNNTEKLC